MDVSKSGQITAEELHLGLHRQGSSLRADQLASLIEGLDSKQTGAEVSLPTLERFLTAQNRLLLFWGPVVYCPKKLAM